MILCVDTGGTKTLVTSFRQHGERAGKPGAMHRFPTPRSEAVYIASLSTLIRQKYDLTDVEAIAIGVPGEITGGILMWCGNLPWKDFDVVARLRSALSFKGPILIDNDANMAALGEAHAIKPLPHAALYVTISTGVNGCLVVDGAIEPGLDRSEMGTMVVEYKGNVTTWENLASGRALYEKYGKFARDIDDAAVWHEIAEKISRGLLDIIPILQPTVIIIGGSVGSYFDRFAAPLRTAVDRGLYAHLARPLIGQARHPEEAVIYGGYAYATHVTPVR